MSDCENISDASVQNGPDSVLSLRSDVDNTKDIGDAGTYKDTTENVKSRKSSISNDTTKSHAKAENLVNPTARSDAR